MLHPVRRKVPGQAEGKDADGNSKHLEREGNFFGYVDVAYPEGAEDATPYESVYDVVERRVVVDETRLELG